MSTTAISGVSSSSSFLSLREAAQTPEPNEASALELRPYIVTNETRCDQTRAILSALKKESTGVHIGVSCWENYNIMIASGATHGILFDASPEVQALNDRTARILAVAQTRIQFMEAFQKTFAEASSIPLVDDHDQDVVRDNSPERLRQEFETPTSWLGSDENYGRIRRMYLENKVVHIVMNILDQSGFEKIGKWMASENLSCRTFYISNVRDWVLKAIVDAVIKEQNIQFESDTDREEFVPIIGEQVSPHVEDMLRKIIAPIISRSTLVIDAGYGSPRLDAQDLCPQYTYRAHEYLNNQLYDGFLR